MSKIISRTPFYAGRWEIRQYVGGTYDGIETVGTGISPGFDTFDEVVTYICEQEAARLILAADDARFRNASA